MYEIIRRTAIVAALLLGTSTLALAAPALHVAAPSATPGASNVEHVDYSWHHQRYHHRSWDKRHHSWRYYN